GGCRAVAVFALARGEHLQLARLAPGAGRVRLDLESRDYLGGVAVLGEADEDDPIRADLVTPASGDVVFDAPIAIAGWYRLTLWGPPELAIEPCVRSR